LPSVMAHVLKLENFLIMKTESTRTIHSTTVQNDVQLILGFVLAFVSTGAMVMTLQSLMQDWVSKALAVLAGIALQGCLYLFSNRRNHRIRAFSWLLLTFSVIATTWFMDATWQQQRQQQAIEHNQQAEQSWQAEQIRNQVNQLNQQIEINLDSASTDTGTSYRQRGIDTLSNLDKLYQRRDNLLEQLNGINTNAASKNSASAFEETAELRISLFAVIALIIDISAILAFASLAKPAVTEPKQPTLTDQQPQQSVITQTLPCPNEPAVQDRQPEAEPEDKPDHLGTILAKIRAGEYGEFVPVKQIVESEPVRHPELKSGIDQLLDEGVLIKSGNRYRHANFEKQA